MSCAGSDCQRDRILHCFIRQRAAFAVTHNVAGRRAQVLQFFMSSTTGCGKSIYSSFSWHVLYFVCPCLPLPLSFWPFLSVMNTVKDDGTLIGIRHISALPSKRSTHSRTPADILICVDALPIRSIHGDRQWVHCISFSVQFSLCVHIFILSPWGC